MNDIDDFESRLNGSKNPPARPTAAVPAKENKQSKQKPPSKAGSSYVQNAVKPVRLSEEQEDAAEGQRAVADIAKFEQRNLKN
eukprot:CAMPEP_0119335812 /NCGR_PEP_ID=MMETSP1333-20130426/90431_1 /TAXON_ID=418940 /ORGANISM="Scyphosphaera apsteinii, Strain RCC1455" /LENGTH=82 /DNA_ID=CAMNT_0007346469 /DNA_START=111 /DNA_END=359 /DNA_ORIENTATION=+